MVATGIIILLLAVSVRGAEIERLPEDFILGFATASYQIEGGWNEDGKGLNYFDFMTHLHPEMFKNNTGDVAADSYHKYKEDVAMLKNLGAQMYRFSLSWSRILPEGTIDVVNQPGIDYYNNLIDELLRNGIQPMITLYHWDLPMAFVVNGGWTNPEIVTHYENFARLAFSTFGDRVKWWLTFNEPMAACMAGYTMLTSPSLYENLNGEYLCTHNVLISNARAYHIYDKEFRPQQQGRIGITLNTFWEEPETNSTADIEAAETRLQFELGWFAHPLLNGDYPPVMRKIVDANSKTEGRALSRLPIFDAETLELVKGSLDFLGINYYTAMLSSAVPPTEDLSPSWEYDTGVTVSQDSSWPKTVASWLKVTPWGFRKLLNWIKREYNNPEVFITENGYADDGDLNDIPRINYYRDYLRSLLEAVHEDDCKVIGYLAWSLMDNFEWFDGYTVKFGVYQVDFESPERTRTPKASVGFFKELTSTRRLPN